MIRAEHTKFWRLPTIEGLELLHASYVTQSFPRHMHDEFAVGVIETGKLGFAYRGRHLVASPGCINLCNAGEYHTGRAASDEGWAYRMFYLHPDLLADAYAQATDKQVKIPFFPAGVITDQWLARRLLGLHRSLETSTDNQLEQQSALISTLVAFILRHSDDPPRLHAVGREHRRVAMIRSYIEACSPQPIRLDELAQIACLSPFHLLRVFQQQIGLPPHAYLTQVRLQRAKNLLRHGLCPAQVALETGFVDQSHLHRHFRRTFGITPGQYSKNVQA